MKRLRLFAGRGEKIAAPPYGAGDGGMGRVALDLAPDTHDPDVDSPVEGFGVACVGEFEQTLTGEDPLRVFGERLEQTIFRRGQRMLVILLVAQQVNIHVEP